MNSVQLIGRLTADPEEFQAKNGGRELATFTLAVNRYGVDQTTDFIKCVCFGSLKDTILKYCGKGSQIGIIGNLKTGSYKNKSDEIIQTVEVVVNNITFTDEKRQ